ncbi:MAG TPA: glucose-1-phosphate cytidylyltransferase, partial [Bacteroidota bacterium]|nr:glucose-1-phosphate cytidylyltransferase [Bacteroidota bacterium]
QFGTIPCRCSGLVNANIAIDPMKLLILCGGQGTRLREETEYKPKPMVEIGGKPILWHIMKLYSFYGIREFVLALGYKGDVIRDYFLNFHYYGSDFTVDLKNPGKVEIHGGREEQDWKVTLVETGKDSMTGYRVKACEPYLPDSEFMLTYGDAVSDVNIKSLLDYHHSQKTIGTVTGVFPPSRFGDLHVEGDRVVRFKEKRLDTTDQSPINGGFFVFKREFLSAIPSDPTCDLERVPLEGLASSGQLSVYRHPGFWQCMDTFRDYRLLNDMWDSKPAWKVWDSKNSTVVK